jgi:hypothetical protein
MQQNRHACSLPASPPDLAQRIGSARLKHLANQESYYKNIILRGRLLVFGGVGYVYILSVMKTEQKEEKESGKFLSTERWKTKSNAISTPSIELPKGGRAIKGIDEKFSV